MACNIIRNENGKVVKVLAENGKNSKLFNDIVKLGYDKETALKKWATTYTPTFKNWFQQGEVDYNGEPRIIGINNVPSFIAEDRSVKHATENIGSFISKKDPSPLLDEIKQKFRLVQSDGSPRNISYREDPYGLAERIEKLYPGINAFVAQDMGGDIITLSVSPHLDPDNIYHQSQANQLAEQDKNIDAAMQKFLKSIGVKIETVNNIRNKNGEILSVNAKADMINKIVEVVKGNIGIDTLPEEAAHFMVELLEAENHPLFESMMNNIENFEVHKEVLEDEFYQEAYQGDVNRLKKEAIGKLIARHIVKSLAGKEAPVNISRTDSWLSQIWDFVKSFFGHATHNPYSEAAHMMLNNTVNEYIDIKRGLGSITGEYFQSETHKVQKKDPTKDTLRMLDEENENWEIDRISLEEAGLKQPWFTEEGNETERYVGKKNGPYEGQHIKGRVSDAVKKHFWKINRGKIRDLGGKEHQLRLDNNETRKFMGTMGHTVLQELVDLYANKKGNRRTILNNSLYTESQFQILEQGVKDLIAQIKKVQKEEVDPEGKVIIKTEQMTTNRDRSVGGSIDLIAIFSDNSAALYDYKFVTPSKAAGYVDKMTNRIIEDPFAVKMKSYDLQISQYKKNLIEHYGVTQVRQSRIIPIHIRFNTSKEGKLNRKITLIQMGTKYSEFLEQIPLGELTKFEDVNRIIRNLLERKQNVDDQLRTKKYKAGESFESLKAKQARITKQLRVLQIDQDVAYIIKSLGEDMTTIKERLGTNNPLLKSGEANPNYLTDQDLNDLLEDLLFYKSLVTLHQYEKALTGDKLKEYEVLRNRLSGELNSAVEAVKYKMLERAADKAEQRGVLGLKSFNLDVSWLTSNFTNLSKQNNPFLRNLWEIVDNINFSKRKLVKAKAEEIQAAQDAFVRGRGIKAFDMLLNEDGSFKSKYESDFYTQRTKANKEGNYDWFDLANGNVTIDQEYYNKKYKEWRAGKMKALKAKFGDNQAAINREIKKWELAHDVKNHPRTASIGKGGQYFLRPADKWISKEYRAIQNDPEAKAFYDLYFKTIQEVEEMFGERLGPNFTAEVHKNFVESAFVNGSLSEAIDSSIESFQVREHDKSFGERDEMSGRLKRQIPKLHITPLRDKNGNIDPSLKSRDLGKGLLLLYDAALDYQLKNDVLPEIQMMEAVLNEGAIEVESTNLFGDIITESSLLKKEQPKRLHDTYQKFVDAYIYGTSLDQKDFKIAGRASWQKSLLGLKNFHSISQLGLKAPVAIGAFGAGMFGLEYEASKGTIITRKNLRKAQAALLKADSKMRGLVEYLDYYQREDAQVRSERLSAQYVTRHLTNDKWFTFLSTADRGIDAITLYATALNYGVDENGMVKRLESLPEGSKSIIELMELTENPLWEGTATNVANKAVDRYKVKIEGLSEQGERKLRNVGREISFKVKGSMTEEDKVLYNQNMVLKLMMHYKSWLPGVATARFGKQRYNNILETFDEGTWISYFGNTEMAKGFTSTEALNTELHLWNLMKTVSLDALKTLADTVTFGYANQVKVKEDLARAKFEVWAANNANNPLFAEKLKDKTKTEELFQEYLVMKRGNIRAFIMEFRAVLALFLLLSQLGRDDDDDGKTDIRGSYFGRKFHNIVNRIYRETAVFVNPKGFLQGGRATGIPLLNLLSQLISLGENTIDEIGDILSGEEPYTNRDRAEKFYYLFKLIPGLNAISKGVEMFPQHKYERF